MPVTVVDSRQVGVATGYAALTRRRRPRRRRRGGRGGRGGARSCRAATALFYVDTLEYLRRGGRIGAAAALLGGALSVKPLLRIDDGRVVNLDRVRTSARALSPDGGPDRARRPASQRVDLCVSHLANPDRAGELAGRLGERLADNLDGREVWCGELGAVLGAHVGPGMVAVCVAPLLGRSLTRPPPTSPVTVHRARSGAASSTGRSASSGAVAWPFLASVSCAADPSPPSTTPPWPGGSSC